MGALTNTSTSNFGGSAGRRFVPSLVSIVDSNHFNVPRALVTTQSEPYRVTSLRKVSP
jgi:hypothetical protein